MLRTISDFKEISTRIVALAPFDELTQQHGRAHDALMKRKRSERHAWRQHMMQNAANVAKSQRLASAQQGSVTFRSGLFRPGFCKSSHGSARG